MLTSKLEEKKDPHFGNLSIWHGSQWIEEENNFPQNLGQQFTCSPYMETTFSPQRKATYGEQRRKQFMENGPTGV
jgi:hypothetical protein